MGLNRIRCKTCYQMSFIYTLKAGYESAEFSLVTLVMLMLVNFVQLSVDAV